ncbi:hypothetical protein [Mesorhizobium sp. Root102]|jgi:hypothetical protein|nr:hypothetical protein [Mesorhizobium sp. Root102]
MSAIFKKTRNKRGATSRGANERVRLGHLDRLPLLDGFSATKGN